MSARTTPRTALGAAIRRHREERRTTQTELGDQSELGQKRISDLESGKHSPGLDEVAALERALGLTRGALLIEAGYCTIATTIADVVGLDPALTAYGRALVLTAYDAALQASAKEREERGVVKPRRRPRAS